MCDKVFLFVSTTDRVRKGQLPIYWKDMKKVWDDYLIGAMPSNVEVVFAGNPTSALLDAIEELEEAAPGKHHFKIFGDAVDAPKTYNPKMLMKYFPALVSTNRVDVVAFSRADNVDISGTKMREFLATGNREQFIKNLPKPVQSQGVEIFDILKPSELTEGKRVMKITKNQLATLVERTIKEQMASSVKREQAILFDLIEDLKSCVRRQDRNRCIDICNELKKRFINF